MGYFVVVTSVAMRMIFSGNPGTVKTTIGRLVAELLHALGRLRKARVDGGVASHAQVVFEMVPPPTPFAPCATRRRRGCCTICCLYGCRQCAFHPIAPYSHRATFHRTSREEGHLVVTSRTVASPRCSTSHVCT